MAYQPNYAGDGQEIGRGARDCASRYEAIRDYLKVFGPAEGLALDFGAAEGYFTARLTEDFPDLAVLAIDDNRQLRRNVHRLRGVRVEARRVPPQQLPDVFRGHTPRVVLLLSVLHHLVDWDVLLQYLGTCGTEVMFVELAEPEEDLPRAVSHVHTADMHAVMENLEAEVIAETPGYRSDVLRRLYVIDFRPQPDPSVTTPLGPEEDWESEGGTPKPSDPADAPEKGEANDE